VLAARLAYIGPIYAKRAAITHPDYRSSRSDWSDANLYQSETSCNVFRHDMKVCVHFLRMSDHLLGVACHSAASLVVMDAQPMGYAVPPPTALPATPDAPPSLPPTQVAPATEF